MEGITENLLSWEETDMMKEEINFDFVALCVCLYSVWSYL